jgi:hypothetical protein
MVPSCSRSPVSATFRGLGDHEVAFSVVRPLWTPANSQNGAKTGTRWRRVDLAAIGNVVNKCTTADPHSREASRAH